MAQDNAFAEKYDLIRKIGEGGMAEIFLARQHGLGGFHKELVIKRIRREFAQNEQYVELFLDEARIAANLNHPNIVHIYDIGKAYGTYYIAMEYIHGADLMDVCRRGIEQQRFLPIEYAVEIIAQVATGLHFAHTFRDETGAPLSIVHRDISPSNILVSYNGVAKLVDFGIAKAANQIHDDAGQVMGKVNYMAPEQLRGEAVDARSDLFSLGVVLYEITAGRRLYRGSGKEVARKILEEPIPPPSVVRPDYPTDLEIIVMRLLEKRPENRYGDAEELGQDLAEFLADRNLRNVRGRLSRYLVDLYDLEGLPIELDDLPEEESPEEDLDFDRPGGAFDADFAQDDEVIFASRLPDSLSGPAPEPGAEPSEDADAAPPEEAPEVPPRRTSEAATPPSNPSGPAADADEDPLAALDALGGAEDRSDLPIPETAGLPSPFSGPSGAPATKGRPAWLWVAGAVVLLGAVLGALVATGVLGS